MYEQIQPKNEPCRLIREVICELEKWGPLTQSACLKLLQAYELLRRSEGNRARRGIHINDGSV
jgi:hypothetical protein